jgi:hypothetical protein
MKLLVPGCARDDEVADRSSVSHRDEFKKFDGEFARGMI